MTAESATGSGTDDDALMKALAELEKPGQFSRSFDSSSHRHDNTLGPIVNAVRLLIAEVEALRDEVDELHRERG